MNCGELRLNYAWTTLELRSNYAPVVAYLKDKPLKDVLVRVKIPSYFQQQDFRIIYDKGQNQK